MTSQTTTPLRIGLAGLGTVGIGLIKILEGNGALLAVRAGRPIEVTAVSARSKGKDRGVDLSSCAWCDNPVELANRTDVDMVVELIGGSEGSAYDLALEALKAGKPFVTANKALIATHGVELAQVSAETGAALKFEAAVAGGIPVVKALVEGLAANQIAGLHGILNGTCNYILTRMEREGLGFDEVLADAQRIGYAEADPTFDIDGIDTAHKTAILGALAFGVKPDIDSLPTEGIRSIAPVDIEYARELGYRIKLLGVVRQVDGALELRVNPAMVPLSSPLAAVMDATNAVVVNGDHVGQTVYEGPGAGQGPTASAVMADIVDVLRGSNYPVFGVPVESLQSLPALAAEKRMGTYYLRLKVSDAPGVMADITNALAAENVSIESLLQRGQAENGGVYIVMTTHQTREDAVTAVLKHFNTLKCVLESPTMLRIEAA